MLNENDVVDAVCNHLEGVGYKVLQRCSTTDHGIDIVATHPSKKGRLLIEAKGGTSSRAGSARFDKGFSRTQVFDRVAKGFYTTACMYAANGRAGDTAAMAYPDTPQFRDYLGRIRPVTESLGFFIFLVKPDHSVEKL